MTLGATELRAYGTAHGAELATLAQRDALGGAMFAGCCCGASAGGPPRCRPVTPTRHDRELVAELAALRSVSRLLERRRDGRPRRNVLERERRRLEAAVQARTRGLRAGARAGRNRGVRPG